MNKKLKALIIPTIAFALWSFLTIIRLINHTPWGDEAHAYTIAEQLSPWGVFNYAKNEGHFFLWYFLLIPFAKLHLYPYPMQIMNWLFCFLAIALLWWKSPFNIFAKVFITFSFPFFACYPILARCYSLGILFLFILASMFRVKTKYPKTYAFVLIMSANTSVMGLIGTIPFGFLFLYELFKEKSAEKKLPILILSIGAFLILWQIFNVEYYGSIVNLAHPRAIWRLINIIIYSNLFRFLVSAFILIFVYPILLYFFKHKQALFYISCSYSLLLYLSTRIYSLCFWHLMFYFIYLIVAFWISDNEFDESKLKKFSVVLFTLISFMMIFYKPPKYFSNLAFNSPAKSIMNFIENDEQLNNSKILHNHGKMYEILPYKYKTRSYIIKNYCTKENIDYRLEYGLNLDCIANNAMARAQKAPEMFKELIDDNTFAYSDEPDNNSKNEIEIITKEFKIHFSKYKCLEEYCFWKVEIK